MTENHYAPILPCNSMYSFTYFEEVCLSVLGDLNWIYICMIVIDISVSSLIYR